MSNYPLGAEFDPNAPWNKKEPCMIECTECGGTGYEVYYDEGGIVITEEEYNALPKNKRERDVCTCCNGEGRIEDCYEPDYDRYDE